MLDWDSASTATKVTMLTALGCIGVGILLAIIGVSANIQWLMFFAIGLLALGVVSHLVGFAVRMADQRRRLRESTTRGAGSSARKGQK